MVGRHLGNFVKLSLVKCKFWLFATVSNCKEDEQRSNRSKCIRSQSKGIRAVKEY